MMRSLRLLFFVLLLSFTTSAQKFYARLGVSYAIPAAFGQELGMNGFPYRPNMAYAERTVLTHKGTLGKGFFTGITFGMKASPNVGIEAELQNLFSQPDFYTGWQNSEIHQYVDKLLLLTTSLTYDPDDNGQGFYFKAGATFALTKKVYTETLTRVNSSTEYFFQSEMTTKPAIGFNLAMGLHYPVAKHVAVYSELAIQYLSCYTYQLNVTKAVRSGVDILASLDKNQKVIDYEKRDYYSPGYPGESAIAKAYRIPFSSFSMKAGVQFNF